MSVRRVLCLVAALAAAGYWLSTPAIAAAAPSGVVVRATINNTAADKSSAAHPVKLHSSGPASVRLEVTNHGASTVRVRRVEIDGQVLGLDFYGFDTSVDLVVGPHRTSTLSYLLDLTGLDGQATGEMNGTITLFDAHEHQIAQESIVTDVRGSLYSVYGLFGLALVVLTLLAIGDVVLAMARHRLPTNRWRRALRTMTPGIGIGLVLVFSLSAAAVWVPTPSHWLLAAACSAAVFFVIGYLTPTPVETWRDDDEPDDETREDELDDDRQLEVFPPTPVPPMHQASS